MTRGPTSFSGMFVSCLMTVDEFIEWESEQPDRWEFIGGQPVPVAQSTHARSLLIADIVAILRPAVRGTVLRVLPNFRIRYANEIRYPAVMVDAGPYVPSATEPTQPFAIIDVDRDRDWSGLPGVRYLSLNTGDEPDRVLTLLPMRTN
ncbi:hypothetical protein GFL58_30650 [Rhizobium leguminosarum bv. viciae]|uniref:Uma2 family endonuclease n=1 Tax=Rhizobium leguminosarum TaxID=384 RepID=UPI00143F2F04|nr:Uma2 family endonuclease [Rhizobium leguminosarum]NKM65279.1 hypothetical protein [Rhizobium leguminosarum bv. viciae]